MRRLDRGLLAAFAGLTGCAGEPSADFSSPAAVIHDPFDDRYLVSNVCGEPVERDNNGFIVSVAPADGSRRLWVRGGQDGVSLHAPRGMAIVDDTLWVADIDVVRRFHRRTAAPLGEVRVPGASMLWGVTAGPEGSVYVSDAGLDGAFAATGSDAIWKISPDGELSTLVRGAELGQPTAISAQRAGIYAVGWRAGGFFQVDYRGTRTDLGKAPEAQLGGLCRIEVPTQTARGRRLMPTWFAGSWEGATVYRFALTGGVTAMSTTFEEPGLIAFDPVRRRLLVPSAAMDRLHVEQL